MSARPLALVRSVERLANWGHSTEVDCGAGSRVAARSDTALARQAATAALTACVGVLSVTVHSGWVLATRVNSGLTERATRQRAAQQHLPATERTCVGSSVSL